jgi:hypothetical protein
MASSEQRDENISYLSRRYFVIIFTTALVVRIVCMVFLHSWDIPSRWDFGWEIGKLGRSLAEGHGFTFYGDAPTAKFPPIYPLLVGGSFAIFGAYSKAAAVILFLFQSICAAFTAIFLAVLGNRFLGRKVGITAGIIWAFYPTSILYSVKFIWYSELVVMLVLLLITIASKPKSFLLFYRVACLGGLSGLIVLTDSTMMIYPVLLLLWIMYACKLTLKEWIFNGVIWFIVFAVFVSLWGIRNYLVLGTPGILKSNFGLELFFGNNPYSTGGGIDKERYQALDALDQEESDYYRKQSEHAYYGYLQKKALEWIQHNPFKFLKLSAKRVWFFWGKFPSSGPGPWKRHTWMQLVWYAPVALLALYGIWYCIGRRWDLIPIWLFLLVYPLPFYITHVQLYRYRYPVEPFLVLLAAIPLTIWFTRCWGPIKKETIKNINRLFGCLALA